MRRDRSNNALAVPKPKLIVLIVSMPDENLRVSVGLSSFSIPLCSLMILLPFALVSALTSNERDLHRFKHPPEMDA